MSEPLTIPALLATQAAGKGSVAVLVADDGRLTFGELDARSRALAARLAAAGVNVGDRVGLLFPNGIDWGAIAASVMRIGAVLVPISTLMRPPELLAALQSADVTHLIAARGFRGRDHLDDLDQAAPGARQQIAAGGRSAALPSMRAIWSWDELPEAAAPRDLVDALEASVRAADDLVILFTSGSSGAPKGVVHTHGGALRATAAGLDARCVRDGDRLYIPMPFFWTGGFSGGLLTALVAGITLLTEQAPEPASTVRFLARERVTLFRGWPEQAERIAAEPTFVAADLSSLKGGSLDAVLPPGRRAPVGGRANLFGMTESFGPYCGDRLDTVLPEAKRGSCGRPFDGVTVRIVDPDTGTVPPAGEQGEIQLRGPNLMRRVWGRDRSTTCTPDGYHRTGDLGVLDADGYLWYRGRLDDMFKVKGATVYPAEVERALRTIPGVRRVHVTSVEGEVGALAVGDDLDPTALATQARERLSAFKVPTRWYLTADADEVPMLASAKIDKRGLQALLLARGEPNTAP